MPWWQLSSWPEASEIHIIRACSSSGQTGISYWTYLRQGLAISFLPPGFFWGAKNLALRNIVWNTSYAAKVIICPLLLMCCSCTMFDLNNFTVLFFNLFSTRTQKTELQTLIPISPKCLNLKNVQPAKTQVQNCNNWSSNSLYFRIYQNHPNSSNSTVFRTLNPRSGFKALHIARKKLPELYAFIIILRAKIRW